MLDLVHKIQGTAKAPRGSFAVLPQFQFDIASAMEGKGRLSAKQIRAYLGWDSNKVAVLLNTMCSRHVIGKNKVATKTTKAYFFSLIVEKFELEGVKS